MRIKIFGNAYNTHLYPFPADEDKIISLDPEGAAFIAVLVLHRGSLDLTLCLHVDLMGEAT